MLLLLKIVGGCLAYFGLACLIGQRLRAMSGGAPTPPAAARAVLANGGLELVAGPPLIREAELRAGLIYSNVPRQRRGLILNRTPTASGIITLA